MFGGDESANIPECKTRAYGASKEELSAAETIDEEEERDNRGYSLDYCKHAYTINQHTHPTKTSVTHRHPPPNTVADQEQRRKTHQKPTKQLSSHQIRYF
jgi:hypothetical protein